jgi:hypothetical protein
MISSIAGIVSEALPHRGAARTMFVVRSESADCRFAVFYKGDKIGAHTVATTPEPGEIRINTEIVLVVKALFFTVFSFSHSSEERWRNERLVFLKSETIERGEKLYVEGASIPQGFRVVGQAGPFIASANALTSNCLWSPAILEQETVIDAQHGGVMGLSVRKLADESILVLGRQVRATRYRFITPYLAGSIWYDDANRWVHGEFERDGALIEYRLEA